MRLSRPGTPYSPAARYVYVTRGLVALADNEAELAGVIAQSGEGVPFVIDCTKTDFFGDKTESVYLEYDPWDGTDEATIVTAQDR